MPKEVDDVDDPNGEGLNPVDDVALVLVPPNGCDPVDAVALLVPPNGCAPVVAALVLVPPNGCDPIVAVALLVPPNGCALNEVPLEVVDPNGCCFGVKFVLELPNGCAGASVVGLAPNVKAGVAAGAGVEPNDEASDLRF